MTEISETAISQTLTFEGQKPIITRVTEKKLFELSSLVQKTAKKINCANGEPPLKLDLVQEGNYRDGSPILKLYIRKNFLVKNESLLAEIKKINQIIKR